VKIWLCGASALVLAASASAQQAPAKPETPKLIVAIAVDQLSSDIFNEYRDAYTGGLKRLTQGVVFPRGHQGHAATETCPGHSTILTGSRPSRTGIIANDWQDPNLPRPTAKGGVSYDIYCAEKPQGAASNFMASGGYIVSPHFLKVPTLGDRMKAANPAARVLSVSGKDRGAVMMGGHNSDLTMWWDGKGFTTFADRIAWLPAGIASLNVRASNAIAKPKPIALPARCTRLSQAVPLDKYGEVGVLKLRKAGDASRWRATPEFDSMTLDAALTAVDTMKLGQGSATDLLAISFSATDYVGHSFGTAGAETCSQVLALDKTLGRLFAALDKTKIPYAVTLTADHGGHDLPERNRTNGLPAAERADIKLSAMLVGAGLQKQFGLADNPLLGRANFGDIYLSTKVPADKRTAIRDAAVALYRAHRQVEAVFTKDELSATPSPTRPVDEWSLIERARASFDPERSGDFLVLLKEYVTPIPDPSMGYVATHGSVWGYDRRVPMLFWWKGVSGFEQPNAVETADILPTLASLINLPVPATEIDGRCLDLVQGQGSNCP
jgi:predicted AlkP superfamily pyrophosphatase or phosphodiesterase